MSKKHNKKPKTTPPRMVNAKEVRAMLLSGCTPIIEDVLKLATGDKNKSDPSSPNSNVNDNARKIVMDAIIPMLQSAGDIQKLRATSTGDIFKMLKDEKITISEADHLMSMLHKDFEMNSLPELMERFESLQEK